MTWGEEDGGGGEGGDGTLPHPQSIIQYPCLQPNRGRGGGDPCT